jgi:coproporphyrinogen III oxidase
MIQVYGNLSNLYHFFWLYRLFSDFCPMSNQISCKKEFFDFIHALQDEICEALLAEDSNATLIEDIWQHPEGGGGKTRVIRGRGVFENGGVNTSAVSGTLPPAMMAYLKTKHNSFYACGISLILHPLNPFIPTVHANFRYFELYDKNNELADCWFGGGVDLTPYYLFEEDVKYFHQKLLSVCDAFDTAFYPKFKKACDDYFYNHHRSEARGVGGLFFDHLRGNGKQDSTYWFDFVKACGHAFLDSYLPIVSNRKHMSYTSEHKKWQEIRRGRYVEFNLIHDKGTLFGLNTKGRIESVLISMPATVKWEYNYQPKTGSEEEKLLDVLRNPKDWV